MKVYRSPTLDIYTNLALEKRLLDGAEDEPSLLFWQSDSTVVMGKNQNPWQEVNIPYCRDHGISIARRFTGGGSVYQDRGNLNYALVLPREGYRMESVLQEIADEFARQGLPAEVAMTNSLFLDGKKFSGHAFCYQKAHVLHHGSLLLTANLDPLRQSLNARAGSIETHAVKSRPASVCNLTDHVDGLSVDAVMDWVFTACLTLLNQPSRPFQPLTPDVQRLEHEEEYRSRDWIWGRTPFFTAKGVLEGQEILISVRSGRIQKVKLGAKEYTQEHPLIGIPFEEIYDSIGEDRNQGRQSAYFSRRA